MPKYVEAAETLKAPEKTDPQTIALAGIRQAMEQYLKLYGQRDADLSMAIAQLSAQVAQLAETRPPPAWRFTIERDADNRIASIHAISR